MRKLSIIYYILLFAITISSSFAADVCGETLSTRWQYTQTTAKFLLSKSFPDRICDSGELVPGANVEILLLDSTAKIIYKKSIYFPMKHISHTEISNKNSDAAIKDWHDFIIVKFPKVPELLKATHFEIKGLGSLTFNSKGEFSP